MKLRRLSTFTALASVIVAAGSFTTAGADAPNTDLGEHTVGETLTFPFSCPQSENTFFLFLNPDTPEQTKIDEQFVDSSGDLPLGYLYDTSELEPGTYGAGIECVSTDDGVYDFTFTLVAPDPCAPVTTDTVEVPKGPGRSPHSVTSVVCEGSGAGIPTTGSGSTTYILLLGTLAIAAGTGVLIARRRIQA